MTNQLPGEPPTRTRSSVPEATDGRAAAQRILIVDDEPANILLLERLLKHAGYTDIASTIDPRQALSLFKEFQPDIVLLDLLMPHQDGFTVMARLQAAIQPDEYLPIVILTADISQEKKRRALAEGASDFLTKPLDVDEVRLRITNLLETRRLHRQVRANLAKERALNELKDRFVSIVSHEFRTPLSTILSSAELLERYGHKWPMEKQSEHFHRIQSAVSHLNQLIQDVLILGKSEAGASPQVLQPVDLEALSRQMLEEFRLTAGKQHMLTLVTTGVPRQAWTNVRLVRQIIDNLLSNAIKYSPHGSQVSLGLHWLEHSVVFEVTDTGIGIAAEDLPNVYDLFFRAKNVSDIPGTGLGLPIVKQCVDQLNGSIYCQSVLNQGTTFRVSVPFDHTAHPEAEEA